MDICYFEVGDKFFYASGMYICTGVEAGNVTAVLCDEKGEPEWGSGVEEIFDKEYLELCVFA